jgi:Cd2+/Zn2+-exporting ATPase
MEATYKKEFILQGLCCASCAGIMETGIGKLAGVREAAIDISTQRLSMHLEQGVDAVQVILEADRLVHQVEPGVVMVEQVEEIPGEKTIYLQGLCCADCAGKIERQVAKLEGVRAVRVDLMAQTMTIETADREVLPILVRKASQIALEVEPSIAASLSRETEGSKAAPNLKARLHQIGLCAGAVLFFVGLLVPVPAWGILPLFGISYLLVGGDVVWRALKNITRGQVFDENFLMSVATFGAFAIGEYPEGVAVMLFYQIGEAFQRLAVNRSRKSITALMDIRPDFANLQTEDGLLRVSPEEVGVGERIVVKAGEKVPLDGVVVEGYSALDTSALTGESLPRDVAAGDPILSGSINKSGLLVVEVTRVFGESTVSKILDLVQNAGGNKSKTENFITKFARYYTPAVVFAALALAVLPPLLVPGALWADWINRALVFLVVSCPCALVISIPLSYFGGIGGASRNGILIKGGNFLEALNHVDTVVFDKTGTLTRGVFRVTEIQSRNGWTEEALLELAAMAESNSNHPIAESICKAYGRPIEGSGLQGYTELAGLGVQVTWRDTIILAGNARLMTQEDISFEIPDTVGTTVHLAANGTYAGYIVIADEIKTDSKEAIRKLKALGVQRTAMLTGDTRAVGERIGAELGLDLVCAELLPQQKVEQLEQLEQNKTGAGVLVYVGDGINDAPVLARSDVGIAMGGVGSDAAIEAADVVLMTDEPTKIVTGIQIARKTRSIVWQNILFALGVKVIILVLGAMGIATMWAAVFGDVGVAVIAILNAMRAMKIVE